MTDLTCFRTSVGQPSVVIVNFAQKNHSAGNDLL